MSEPSPQIHYLNGHRDLSTRVAILENEHASLKADVKEIKSDVKGLRRLAERAIGGAIALGVVWGIVQFVVPLFVK